MKHCFAILILIASGTLGWGAISNELVQDKPDRLYVCSDTLSTASYTDNLTSDNQGGVMEGKVWHQDYYLWQDAIGGSGWQQDVLQSDEWASTGFLGWTNITSSQMTWAGDGSGIQVYTANDDSTASYDIGLPLLNSEHCVVNDPQSPPPTLQDLGGGNWVTNQVQQQYVRYSQTRWRLQTGGRASRNSLFQLSGTATQILDRRAQRPFYNAHSQLIPPQNINLLAQMQPADGNLWVVLPDGANLDVTPFVAGQDFYLTQVAEQKYAPSILINNLSLDTGTPEFCAGQCLQFTLVFDPPPFAVNQASLWNLPGAPVNESSQPGPNGSVNYQFDPTLLTNLSTRAWYAGGTGGKACVGTGLSFTNGQYCVLAVKGGFSLATPVFSGFQSLPSQVGFTWASPVLQASMQWQTTVQSAWDGNVGITQLISGTNSYCNTGGPFWLDGSQEIYNSNGNPPGQTYIAAVPSSHLVSFQDTRSMVANPAANMKATFIDYLRFRPAGSSNIWVTLATNNWSIDGSASLSAGLIRSNLAPAGILVQCAAFPAWTNSYAH